MLRSPDRNSVKPTALHSHTTFSQPLSYGTEQQGTALIVSTIQHVRSNTSLLFMEVRDIGAFCQTKCALRIIISPSLLLNVNVKKGCRNWL